MVDKKLISHMDIVILIITLALAAAGIASIYSATFSEPTQLYKKEFYWLLIGLMFMAPAVIFNYYILERFAYILYGGSVILLLSVFAIGKSTGGAQRWIDLGFLSIQPSEIAKLALIVILARYFSSRTFEQRGLGVKDLIVPAIMMIIPFFLIVKQPDLGTAIILWMIFWSMTLVVGIRAKTIAAIVVSFAVTTPFVWMGLKDYQKVRLTSFINPEGDPFGSGYHLLQSKIAIGSGGFLGKGFLEGTQGKLMFLPEHHTDFIFSILAEEWGFIGAIFILTLFLILILRGLNTAATSKDRFGFLLAFGITAMFFWHTVINLGMVSGLLTVVGVPLPFISYGGSFLVVSIVSAGILINIRMRRFIF